MRLGFSIPGSAETMRSLLTSVSHLNALRNLLLEKMPPLTPAVSQSVVYTRTTDGREEGQIKDFIHRKLVFII